MRYMSFALTTEQVRNRTKGVTRRLGWAKLKPGERLMAAVKCQGIKKGEHVEKICEIECVTNTAEPLNKMEIYPDYGKSEVILEGFPKMTGKEFVTMFCEHNKCLRHTPVNRIAFKYV